MNPPRILLIGYNGANNTGAEALLQADIDDLRAVFGDDAVLTVPALKDPANLRRYLHEGPTLRIVRMPSVFLAAARAVWCASTTWSCWSRAAPTWIPGPQPSSGTSCGPHAARHRKASHALRTRWTPVSFGPATNSSSAGGRAQPT